MHSSRFRLESIRLYHPKPSTIAATPSTPPTVSRTVCAGEVSAVTMLQTPLAPRMPWGGPAALPGTNGVSPAALHSVVSEPPEIAHPIWSAIVPPRTRLSAATPSPKTDAGNGDVGPRTSGGASIE